MPLLCRAMAGMPPQRSCLPSQDCSPNATIHLVQSKARVTYIVVVAIITWSALHGAIKGNLTSSGTWSPTAAFTLGSCTSTRSQWLSKLARSTTGNWSSKILGVHSGVHHVKCCSAVV